MKYPRIRGPAQVLHGISIEIFIRRAGGIACGDIRSRSGGIGKCRTGANKNIHLTYLIDEKSWKKIY
jgi:hypothetical protein